ncbi:Neuro-bHLH multi-domain protein [Pyrenophora tritici-repentis]|nr:Neuro-bHLH multi-domain protein [Pyrenophora tritici-repentis]KAI1559377.1 Neuro-bHLH multi-domain protein [Pyrenophora tritici-repentis]KAI1562966.1 Neuro-bHLH multi-domain protein [Pyrenophora tritici-repentis]
MAPSQYGMSHYGNPQSSYSNGYPPQQSYAEPRSSTSGPYGSSYSSSPAPNESQQSRPEQHAALPPYQPQHPSLPRSPYQQQQSADSIRANNAPMASASHSYTYSAPQNNSFPNQPLGNNNYPPFILRLLMVSTTITLCLQCTRQQLRRLPLMHLMTPNRVPRRLMALFQHFHHHQVRKAIQ